MGEYVKIGRTVYEIIAQFTSLDGQMLYVGTTRKDYVLGYSIYQHAILAKDKNGKWYKHV